RCHSSPYLLLEKSPARKLMCLPKTSSRNVTMPAISPPVKTPDSPRGVPTSLAPPCGPVSILRRWTYRLTDPRYFRMLLHCGSHYPSTFPQVYVKRTSCGTCDSLRVRELQAFYLEGPRRYPSGHPKPPVGKQRMKYALRPLPEN